METTTLQVFNFQNHGLRVFSVEGQPWLIAKEVCDVLGIANSRDALTRLREYEKADVGITDTSSNGVTQRRSISVISQSGVLRLVLTSRKPEAEAFQDWLVLEVIPAILKTGRYEMPGAEPAPTPLLEPHYQPVYVSPPQYQPQPNLLLIEAIGAMMASCDECGDFLIPMMNRLAYHVEAYDSRLRWPHTPSYFGAELKNSEAELLRRGIAMKKTRRGPGMYVRFWRVAPSETPQLAPRSDIVTRSEFEQLKRIVVQLVPEVRL